nr:MAG TPA: hypothetical protein [Caudoviricetes sp.]
MTRINPRLVSIMESFSSPSGRKLSNYVITPSVLGRVIDGKPVLNSTGTGIVQQLPPLRVVSV